MSPSGAVVAIFLWRHAHAKSTRIPPMVMAYGGMLTLPAIAEWSNEAAGVVSDAAMLALGERPSRARTSAGEQSVIERAVIAMREAGHWLADRARFLLDRARDLWWRVALGDHNVVRWADLRAMRAAKAKQMDFEDLRQEARSGLYEAARRWDPSIAAFSTYARWWVRAALQAAIGGPMLLVRGATDDADLFEETDEENATPPWDPIDYSERSRLARAVGGLDAPARWAIEQHMRGRTFDEIGRELGMSLARAFRLHASAQQQLRSACGVGP